MKNEKQVHEWMSFAVSALELARYGKSLKKVQYWQLCFWIHQATVRSLKGIFAAIDKPIPDSDAVDYLFQIMRESGIKIPKQLRSAQKLTVFAAEYRHDDFFEPVTLKEYQRALKTAEHINKWSDKIIKQDKTPRLF